MVLAFSLTLTGAAAYIGIQQENTDKTEAAGSLTAGVSASLNASEVEALDVTAGVTSQLYDKTDVAVAANEKQMVAQGIEDTQTKEAVSENTTKDTSICGYKNLGIAQVQGSLNVRKKASTDSKVVGKMTDKDACEIVSVKGDWAKITSGKVEGYVKTEYLLTGDAAKNVAKIDKKDLMQYILPQDLKSFGLIPEIIGRLPVLTYLNPLDREALRKILVEPKNSIVKQYQKLFEMDGIKLKFDEEALDYIVDKAVEYKLGARGLRSIVEAVMMDAMFEIPSEKVKSFTVTLEYTKQQLDKSHLGQLETA